MIYKSIADRLRLRLNSADFAIGSPLPGEKKLAEEFGVARMTIRKAIDLLVDWGLVVRRHGSGTYVARKDVHHETSNLTGLAEVLRKQGKEVVSQVLAFEVMPAPFLNYSVMFRNASEYQVDYHLRRVQAQSPLAQPPEQHGE